MNEQESTIQETEILADQQNWDEGWDDELEETDGLERDEGDQSVESESEIQSENQTAVDQTADSQNEEDAPAADQQPEAQPVAPFLVLKHLDETREVTREEATELAQKGMDYDRVRERMDSFKKELDEARPALTLVKQYADMMKMTVTEYLDYCRTQELVNGGMSEEQAKRQVDLDKREADLSAKEAAAQQADTDRKTAEQTAQAAKEKQQRDFNDFIKRFPTVKATDIPKEVWDAVGKGDSLVTAYTQYQLTKANEEIAALKANEEARKRTPGSLHRTEHKPTGNADPFDEDWYSDD